MASLRAPNFTNSQEYHSECMVADERSPLLKNENARFNQAISHAAKIDVEAAREEGDKSDSTGESRNIGSFISILLIGLFFVPPRSVVGSTRSRK